MVMTVITFTAAASRVAFSVSIRITLFSSRASLDMSCRARPFLWAILAFS